MAETIRTFIAFCLPVDIQNYLGSLISEFKKTAADVKWVRPENIHLTLKFLGEQDNKRIKAIKQIIDETAVNYMAFSLELAGVGGFPTLEAPRVIWMGIAMGDKETRAIAEELDEKISRLGIPKESRPFSSHITIGRVRSPLNRQTLVSAIKNCAIEEKKLKFAVERITLYKSTLTSQGPIYEVIHEASLKKT